MYCMHEMEPPGTNYIPVATGPPPPYQGPLDYSGATPSAPFGQNAPQYQEIGGYTPQPHQPPRASEQAPLLIQPPVPAPRRNQVNERQPPVGPVVTERFSFEKFVFVWLGIGRPYSTLCLVIFVFIAIWGIGVIGLSVTSIVTTTINNQRGSMFTPSDLYLMYSLCIASGITFVLIGLFWSFTYCWNRKVPAERNFTALGCYSCFLVMLVACCAVGVGIELYEKQDYFIPGSLNIINLAIYEWLPPLLALGSLATTVAIFLCCSCCCVCCCKRRVGRVC